MGRASKIVRVGPIALSTVLLTGLLAWTAPQEAAADDAATLSNVTYAKDIAPILNENCSTCHRPEQVAPMSLLNYQQVRPWAKSIKKAVVEGTMPPWHASPDYGEFKGARVLSSEDIGKIVAWVDQGARGGDLSQAPPEPQFDDVTWRIGKPDALFTMTEPFHVSDDVVDRYEHFVIPASHPEDRDIVAMEIRAGAAEVVHHVLVYAIPNSVDNPNIFEDPTTAIQAKFITGWAPGTDPLFYSDDYGKRLPANHDLIFQLHYHKEAGPGTGATDQSTFAVKFADEPVERPATTAWIMDPLIQIPPHDPNYESISQFTFKNDGHILNMVPHMHLRGKDFRFVALYPDGKEEILLDVPRYDFNWQTVYENQEPKFVPKGTVIRAIAHFDNSADNPYNPDPTQTVIFNEATTDEMMIGFMEYAYVDKSVPQTKWGFPENFDYAKMQQQFSDHDHGDRIHGDSDAAGE